MPLNLASPGILVREVDLTVGRVDPTSDKIGAIVGPFDKGPVELPTLVQNEKDLIETFGKAYTLQTSSMRLGCLHPHILLTVDHYKSSEFRW